MKEELLMRIINENEGSFLKFDCFGCHIPFIAHLDLEKFEENIECPNCDTKHNMVLTSWSKQ